MMLKMMLPVSKTINLGAREFLTKIANIGAYELSPKSTSVGACEKSLKAPVSIIHQMMTLVAVG